MDEAMQEEVDKLYFTPSIEDIRVGYECERKMYNSWTPTVIKSTDNIDGIIYAYTVMASDSIRVPYLTKEQIEAEGWIHQMTQNDWVWYEKYNEDADKECIQGEFYEEDEYTGKTYTEIGYRLDMYIDFSKSIPKGRLGIGRLYRYCGVDKKLWNTVYESGKFWHELYRGHCNDINTFRYICKLLGI